MYWFLIFNVFFPYVIHDFYRPINEFQGWYVVNLPFGDFVEIA